jgi:hypothetical protein
MFVATPTTAIAVIRRTTRSSGPNGTLFGAFAGTIPLEISSRWRTSPTSWLRQARRLGTRIRPEADPSFSGLRPTNTLDDSLRGDPAPWHEAEERTEVTSGRESSEVEAGHAGLKVVVEQRKAILHHEATPE